MHNKIRLCENYCQIMLKKIYILRISDPLYSMSVVPGLQLQMTRLNISDREKCLHLYM